MHLEIETNVFHYKNADGSVKTYHTFAVALMCDDPENSEFALIKRWGKAGTVGQFNAEKFTDAIALRRARDAETNKRLKKGYAGRADVVKTCSPAGMKTRSFNHAVGALIAETDDYISKDVIRRHSSAVDQAVFRDNRLVHEIERMFSSQIKAVWGVDGEYKDIFEPESEIELERAEEWGAW